MFVYYYVHVERPFAVAEPALLRMIPGLGGWANDAYRAGEHLRARLGTRGGKVAKTVAMTSHAPVRGETETWIPIRWEATGTPSLFPSMEGDIVAAGVGPSLTQIALRGTYTAPFGRVGEAIDRVVLHRIAEASVKSLVDSIAQAIEQDPLLPAALKGA